MTDGTFPKMPVSSSYGGNKCLVSGDVEIRFAVLAHGATIRKEGTLFSRARHTSFYDARGAEALTHCGRQKDLYVSLQA